MDPVIDPFSAVHRLAVAVQELQVVTQPYLGDPERNPLHLTAHLISIRSLLNDMGDHVFGNVPDAVFAHHWTSTVHLEEALLSLEAGYLDRWYWSPL